VFPVRYELNFYTLGSISSAFKGLRSKPYRRMRELKYSSTELLTTAVASGTH
jgi:hypothetical protein